MTAPPKGVPNRWESRRRLAAAGFTVAVLALVPDSGLAHATEQPFVLLLPTGMYILSGVAAVVLTLALLGVPKLGSLVARLRGHRLAAPGLRKTETATSLLSALLLAGLVLAGFRGSTDPLANPLPLFVWTAWWIVLMFLQALIGDLWRWFNPWMGVYRLVRAVTGTGPFARLPRFLGVAPGLAIFVLFAMFLIVDLAPTDPRRLAAIVSAYWVFTLAGMLAFGGRAWMSRCEFATIFMSRFAAIAPLSFAGSSFRIGLPGWQVLHSRPGVTLSLFVLFMLGTGSFESLYATFWWLSLIGINPLDFPGRSAIVWQTTGGLLGANLAIALVFSAAVAAGLALVGEMSRYGEAFRRQAQCVLPIVVGYHVAHYLVSLLVDGQYLFAAISDPFATGADYLGLGDFHVTTGFLNTRESVRIIWLSQAGAVVAGHILAILLSHGIALDMFKRHGKATASQIPISVFMIAYTFFGLWLLASPRGL